MGRGLYALREVASPNKVVSRVNGVHLKGYLMLSEQVCFVHPSACFKRGIVFSNMFV